MDNELHTLSAEGPRLDPEVRRELILLRAVKLAANIGYLNITRDGVAEAAGVSCGLVTHYFKSIDELRRQVMLTAIRDEILSIILEGLAVRDETARNAPIRLREAALASI